MNCLQLNETEREKEGWGEEGPDKEFAALLMKQTEEAGLHIFPRFFFLCVTVWVNGAQSYQLVRQYKELPFLLHLAMGHYEDRKCERPCLSSPPFNFPLSVCLK